MRRIIGKEKEQIYCYLAEIPLQPYPVCSNPPIYFPHTEPSPSPFSSSIDHQPLTTANDTTPHKHSAVKPSPPSPSNHATFFLSDLPPRNPHRKSPSTTHSKWPATEPNTSASSLRSSTISISQPHLTSQTLNDRLLRLQPSLLNLVVLYRHHFASPPLDPYKNLTTSAKKTNHLLPSTPNSYNRQQTRLIIMLE